MNPVPPASLLALALLLAPALAVAKSSDRNQPIYLDSDNQTATASGEGTSIWSGNVTLSQGTLNISASRAELTQRNGDPSRAVFFGKPVRLKQQMDDGGTMTATADKVDYDLNTEEIVFTGNYTVTTPRGSNSGQRLVYNARTGAIQGGGDGTRVRTVIQPKRVAPAAAPQGGS